MHFTVVQKAEAVDVVKYLDTAQVIKAIRPNKCFPFTVGRSFFHVDNKAQLSLTIRAKVLAQITLGFGLLIIFYFLSPSM